MVNPIRFGNVAGVAGAANARPAAQASGTSFAEVLKQAQAPKELRFSAHALKRLEERGIELTPADHARIERALEQAEAKGSRESLLLMDQLALVVSVPNRTVITAVARDGAEDAVFTNIDSAVVVADEPVQPKETAALGLDPVWGSPRVVER